MKYAPTLFISLLLLGFSIFTGTVKPASAQSEKFDIVGAWEGTLKPAPGVQLRIVFHVARSEDDVLSATMDSPDQGAFDIPMDSATFEEGTLKIVMAAIAGSYEGTWNAEKELFDGIWSQGGGSFDLDLKRHVEEELEEEGNL